MTIETRPASHCLACGCPAAEAAVTRKDGLALLRCSACSSLYLESIPTDVAGLYADNYFALDQSDAERNRGEGMGYEGSYDSTYRNTEFYWAARLSDFIAQALQGGERTKRCLDIGAATGRLLNVFKALGYDTHGVEFSGPARAIAQRYGHAVYGDPVGMLDDLTGKFPVVTALEVIEHIEDLPSFFADAHRLMTSDGVFMGYFPSADDRWFGATPEYHWLNHSLEHLVYPSEEGIRRALNKSFGKNVFVTTFMTVQGKDIIPFTIVIAFKGDPDAARRSIVGELFRQLRYLTDPEFIRKDLGAAALGDGWIASVKLQKSEAPADIPFIAALLCSKLGMFSVPLFMMQQGFSATSLTVPQIVDLLAMAQHLGGIHFMRDLLIGATGRSLPLSIKEEFQRSVDEYEARNTPQPSGVVPK
jgi:SAM-dependent methyltransferase